MKNFKQNLQIEQFDRKIKSLKTFASHSQLEGVWINYLRDILSISLKQLGQKLNMSSQGVKDMEKRERDKNISLRVLEEVADVLDLKLVYGFVPKDKSLSSMIDKKAEEVAKKIVLKTAKTMQLENQANSKTRIKRAIKDRAEELKIDLKKLWD